jgi:probable O-glycosylation ligase (exosortase A-associated)
MLTVWLFQDRQKLRILVMVIALSLGFYGLKGGLFVLATGGHWMVLGPPESFFATNTELALVLNMSLPMSLYLAREEPRRWLRVVLWATFGLSALAVPFTYSRGGFVGLLIVLAVLFLKARHRLVIIPVAVAVIVAFVALAPEHWFDRIETLETYQEDESANLRFMSWRVSYEIAADRPLGGGGFNVFRHRETYDIYMPEYPRTFGHDAHSIYFNFLGEHGWIGLGLFLLLVLSCFHSLRQLRRLGKTNEDFRWVANYAHMIQASLIAYLVTGAFLSVAYFDLSYQLYIMVGLLKGLVSQQMATAAEGAAAPAAIAPSAAVATRVLPRPRVS